MTLLLLILLYLIFPTLDPTCILLPPRVVVQQSTQLVSTSESLSTGLSNSIAAALSTRFNLPVSITRKYLQKADIEEWGKVRRVDSEAGDTMHSSGLSKHRVDQRDATFVRVSDIDCSLIITHVQGCQYVMLVDKFAHMRRRRPEYEPKTFYGQLEHLYLIKFSCSGLGSDMQVNPQIPVILAAIRNCKIREPGPTDLEGLDIHLYNTTGSLDVVDITSIQALVGRVKYSVDGGGWAVIDRSGGLAQAEWDPMGEDDEYL